MARIAIILIGIFAITACIHTGRQRLGRNQGMNGQRQTALVSPGQFVAVFPFQGGSVSIIQPNCTHAQKSDYKGKREDTSLHQRGVRNTLNHNKQNPFIGFNPRNGLLEEPLSSSMVLMDEITSVCFWLGLLSKRRYEGVTAQSYRPADCDHCCRRCHCWRAFLASAWACWAPAMTLACSCWGTVPMLVPAPTD